MNQGQEKFYRFIMANVKEEEKDQAEKLLKESFEKQDIGTFNQEYMQDFIPNMLKCIRPEQIDNVRAIMERHKV